MKYDVLCYRRRLIRQHGAQSSSRKFPFCLRISGQWVSHYEDCRLIWESGATVGLGSVHTCNVTACRNTVSWQCGRDSWRRNVSKVGYAVTLRACSVCCRYLAVASKRWYGYGLSRCGRATWRWLTACSKKGRHYTILSQINPVYTASV